MATYTLFSQAATGSSLVSDASPYTMGVEFSVSTTATLTAIWFYSAAGAAVLPASIALFSVTGQLLVHSETASWSGAAGSGWVSAPFTVAPALTTAVNYRGAVQQPAGVNWYSATSHYWDTGAGGAGLVNGPLSAPDDAGSDVGQDSFDGGSSLSYPANSFNATNYWVDVAVTVSGGAAHTATASLALAPAFTAGRARGKYRTATLAVTPSFTASRTRGKYRTAVLALAPQFSAARARGRHRTAALALTPSFTAARVRGHDRTAGLPLTPSFTAARVHGHSRTALLAPGPSFTAARTRGRYRTAGLPLSPQFLGRRSHGSSRTASLLVTPVFRATGQLPAGPAVIWATGTPFTQWLTGTPWTEWDVSFTTIGLSQLATEYVLIPVTATKAGASYNPTGDAVRFAFMPTPTQVPQPGDWVDGSWDADSTNILYPYSAKCLVGPAGITNPGIGTYVIYIKITDVAEIPVRVAGQLQIS